MHATEVVGYAADATILCPDCFRALGYVDGGEDHEGNPVHAIFACSDDAADFCGECGASLEGP